MTRGNQKKSMLLASLDNDDNDALCFILSEINGSTILLLQKFKCLKKKFDKTISGNVLSTPHQKGYPGYHTCIWW